MAEGRLASVLRGLHRLFGQETPDAPSDGHLLERFVLGGDESAFADLVRRHGPMVLRVCNNVLRDSHGADDAFQATFLVLAKRAGSIRRSDSVASWLHGVAYRVAVRCGPQRAFAVCEKPRFPAPGNPGRGD